MDGARSFFDLCSTHLHPGLERPDTQLSHSPMSCLKPISEELLSKRERLRIDLAIFNHSQRWVCVVENKIHIGEHSNQLTKYRSAIETHYPGYRALFVFLTLKNEEPGDRAYIPISYSDLNEAFRAGIRSSVAASKCKIGAFEARNLLFRHCTDYMDSFTGHPLPSVNVFRALSLREIKHSDFWAWLFNPLEKHGLGDCPLRSLFDLCSKRTGKEYRHFSLADVEIFREMANIDILIVSEADRFVCAIEIKVDAQESAGQLERYERFVSTWYPGFERLFVYLTPPGATPSHGSYVPIAFSDFRSLFAETPDGSEPDPNRDFEILIREYNALLENRLVIRQRAHLELPPAIDSLCARLYAAEPIRTRTLVQEARESQDHIRNEMEKFLGKLLAETYSGRCFRPDRFKGNFSVFLGFVPEDFKNVPPLWNGGSDGAYTGQLFGFVFINMPFRNLLQNAEPMGVTLKAGLGPCKPGFEAARELTYEIARNHRDVFNTAGRESLGNRKRLNLLTWSLCSREDFIRLPLEAVQEKIAIRFRRFHEHVYPRMLKLLDCDNLRDFEQCHQAQQQGAD